MKPKSIQENTTSSDRHPFTVALTGGIASGKSLISNEFLRLGVPVIDTDVIAREIVEPGQPALHEIERVMGSQFINEQGQLDRSRLRALIFSDANARQRLESILHPGIRQQAYRAISKISAAYCVLVIPLLTEKGNYPNVDRVLVVDVEPEVQISRLIDRDNCSRKQAKQALAAQASRAQRLKLADDVLDNSGSPLDARKRVAQLHLKYMQLAKGS